ncbi:hypothetical protein HZY86_01245 [Aerococcaceae bacterium DSM 111020]|nr:hypothetical protein [Aerococcaceae bacterium DSM 111020]
MIPKFRGFSIKADEWVEGSLIYREKPYLHDIVVPIGNNSSVSYAVDRNSISQYSGLKDINGQKIFDGDILVYIDDNKIRKDEKHVVKWYRGGFEPVMYYNTKNFEIIGNVYEHAELLEVEE